MGFFDNLKNAFGDKPQERPKKRNDLVCFRCGSKRVIQNETIGVSTYDLASGTPLSYQVALKDKGNLGRSKAEYEWVYANLCADCGHIDWHMSPQKANALWEAYQKKQRPDGFK